MMFENLDDCFEMFKQCTHCFIYAHSRNISRKGNVHLFLFTVCPKILGLEKNLWKFLLKCLRTILMLIASISLSMAPHIQVKSIHN